MNERMYALDFLRTFMMLLGILFHAIHFEPRFDFLNEQWNHYATTFVKEIIHTFRMPLFYFLSGYLSAQILSRLGSRRFLRNRFQKLFVPLCFSMLTVGLLTNLLYHALVLSGKGYAPLTALRMSITLRHFNFADVEPVHLWFLYYLSVFIPGMLVLQMIVKRLPCTPFIRLLSHAKSKARNYVFVIFLLAAVPTLVLFLTNSNGNPTPRSFRLSLSDFLPYFYYFAFGWCVRSFRLKLQYFVPKAGWFLAIGLLLTVARLVAWSLLGWEHALIILAFYNLSLLCYIFGFLGIVQRYFSKPSAPLQYFSEASYWIYLVHYPLIVLVKLFLVSAVSVSFFCLLLGVILYVCVISYNYLVRPTVIGKFLNGKTLAPYPFHKFSLTRHVAVRLRNLVSLPFDRYTLR